MVDSVKWESGLGGSPATAEIVSAGISVEGEIIAIQEKYKDFSINISYVDPFAGDAEISIFSVFGGYRMAMISFDEVNSRRIVRGIVGYLDADCVLLQ